MGRLRIALLEALAPLEDPLQFIAGPGMFGAEFWLALELAIAFGLLAMGAVAWRRRRAGGRAVFGAGVAALLVAAACARWTAPELGVGRAFGAALRAGLPFALAALAGAWLARSVRPRALPLATAILLPALAAVVLTPSRRPEVVAPPQGPARVENGMVFVPAGPFLFGSLDAAQLAHRVGNAVGDEHPVRELWLDAFWIDRTEVTNAQFARFVAATRHRTNAEERGTGEVWLPEGFTSVAGADWRHPIGPGSSIAERDDHPVVQVSWFDASAFCAWAGKRLPSEAEWEKAARGSDGRAWPWGADFDPARLNYCDRNCTIPEDRRDEAHDDGYAYTAPVGSFPAGASPYGALDMAGNVWEWVEDWYHADAYAFASPRNPHGPWPGRTRERVVRGGSFAAEPGYTRAASRSYDAPDTSFFGVGFRCAR